MVRMFPCVSKVPQLAFTGGPCAGKSIAVEALRSALAGRVVVVPEIATTLLASFPNTKKDVLWSPEWQESLQRAILHTQVEAERAWQMAALHQGAKVIVCDRGILDGAAYRNETAHQFCEYFQLDVDQVHASYAGVIHLQTVAAFSADAYNANMASNPQRFESAERAVELDEALRRAWDGHPSHHFIPACESIGRKIDSVIEFVRRLL